MSRDRPNENCRRIGRAAHGWPAHGSAWLARVTAYRFAIFIGSDYAFPPMSLFCADAFVSPLEIEQAVTRALEEDLGRAGDITSIATVPGGTTHFLS